MMRPVWVLGSGGHAKVVIDSLRASGLFAVAGLLDDEVRRHGEEVLGVRVKGPVSAESVRRFGVEHALLAIGSNAARTDVARRLEGLVRWVSAVHPRAYVAPDTEVGEGTLIAAGAIIQPGSVVGRHVIVNTGSSVDHDCDVGSFVHVAPGARLAGDVTVREGALLGVGSVVLPGCTIGAWAVVGGGAVVVNDVPTGVTARGVPARFTPRTPSTLTGAL